MINNPNRLLKGGRKGNRMHNIRFCAVPFLDVFGRAQWAKEAKKKLTGYFALIPTSGNLFDPYVRKVRYANFRRVLECAGVQGVKAVYLPTTLLVRTAKTVRHEYRTGTGVKDRREKHLKPKEYRVDIQTMINKGINVAIAQAKFKDSLNLELKVGNA